MLCCSEQCPCQRQLQLVGVQFHAAKCWPQCRTAESKQLRRSGTGDTVHLQSLKIQGEWYLLIRGNAVLQTCARLRCRQRQSTGSHVYTCLPSSGTAMQGTTMAQPKHQEGASPRLQSSKRAATSSAASIPEPEP